MSKLLFHMVDGETLSLPRSMKEFQEGLGEIPPEQTLLAIAMGATTMLNWDMVVWVEQVPDITKE